MNNENIKTKLMMMVAAVAVAFGAWADTETVGGYTWTYRINGNTAEIYNDYSAAISPRPTGSVTIPSTLGGKLVTSIGSYAFSGCSGLTSVTIPNSVTSIGYGAFSGCSGLKSVHITDIAKWCGISFGGYEAIGGNGVSVGEYEANPLYYAHDLYLNGEKVTALTIPNGVTRIADEVFRWCSGLTSVTIPDSVTSIESFAFEDCSGLTSVTIGNGVTSIGYSAFSGCSGLTSVVIGNGVMSIGYDAFCGCSDSLFDTTTISGVKLIDGWAIGYTDALSGDLDLTGIRGIADNAFQECSGLTSVTIPDSVTSIGYGAFSGCSGLTSVTIPNSVTSIETFAFENCSGLTSVTIGNGVTSIGNMAFDGCSGLNSVTIPDSVTSIGDGAFSGCSGLKSVTIPDSVTSIGSSAFADCSGFLFDTVTIPGVRLVDGWAVGYTDSLSGDLDLTGIRGIADNAFQECSGLTSVTIPNSVTSIGDYAFYDCSGLTSVTIPDSVEYIGKGAFFNEDEMQVVMLVGDHPVTVSNPYLGGDFIRYYEGGDFIGYRPAIPEENSIEYVPMEGYRFYGWKDADGNVVERPFHQMQDVTLYPDLRRLEWTVTFDANCAGVQMDIPVKVVTNGCMVGGLPVPLREGYVLAGWFTAADGGELVAAETLVTNDVTFYAQWTANGYMVAFDANGGKGEMGGVSWTYDSVTNLDSCGFERTGYTFAGWATNETGDVLFADGAVVSNLTAVADGNVMLYAVWTPNRYTLTFDSAGDSDVASIMQDYGTAVTAPDAPVKVGYTFTGWSPEVPETMPSEDMTFTAQWTANGYSVVFDANGGEGGATNELDYASEIVAPTVARTGYTFAGWSPEVDATVPASNVTYTALWTEIPPPPPPDSGELDVRFAKAQTVDGALYKGDALVGTVQVKVGKISKKGVVKVSATATLMVDGKAKKVTAKAVNVNVGDATGSTDATERVPPVKVVFKEPIGEMAFEMEADGSFTLKNGSYLMAEAKIGGVLGGGSSRTFRMEGFNLAVPGRLLENLLPTNEVFSVFGGKWAFMKAATVKWTKPKKGAAQPEIYDEGSGKGLIVDETGGKINRSGLKLSYTAKTGQFKGSFKVYALEGGGSPGTARPTKTKLVKYMVNVIGFVVDGVGYGEALCKKPAGTWTVTVE